MDALPAYFRTKERLKKLLRIVNIDVRQLRNSLISVSKTTKRIYFGTYQTRDLMIAIFESKYDPDCFKGLSDHTYKLCTTDAKDWWQSTIQWLQQNTKNQCLYAVELEKSPDNDIDKAYIHLFRFREKGEDLLHLYPMPLCSMCSVTNLLAYAPFQCCRNNVYCSSKCYSKHWYQGHFTHHVYGEVEDE